MEAECLHLYTWFQIQVRSVRAALSGSEAKDGAEVDDEDVSGPCRVAHLGHFIDQARRWVCRPSPQTPEEQELASHLAALLTSTAAQLENFLEVRDTEFQACARNYPQLQLSTGEVLEYVSAPVMIEKARGIIEYDQQVVEVRKYDPAKLPELMASCAGSLDKWCPDHTQVFEGYSSYFIRTEVRAETRACSIVEHLLLNQVKDPLVTRLLRVMVLSTYLTTKLRAVQPNDLPTWIQANLPNLRVLPCVVASSSEEENTVNKYLAHFFPDSQPVRLTQSGNAQWWVARFAPQVWLLPGLVAQLQTHAAKAFASATLRLAQAAPQGSSKGSALTLAHTQRPRGGGGGGGSSRINAATPSLATLPHEYHEHLRHYGFSELIAVLLREGSLAALPEQGEPN